MNAPRDGDPPPTPDLKVFEEFLKKCGIPPIRKFTQTAMKGGMPPCWPLRSQKLTNSPTRRAK